MSNLVGLLQKFLQLKVFSQRDTLQLSGYVCRAVQRIVCADILRQAQVQCVWGVTGSDLGGVRQLPRFISRGDALHSFSCALCVSLSQVKIVGSKTPGKLLLLLTGLSERKMN